MHLGLTNWLSCYGEIVFVQVIKEASEIPENLKPYASKVELQNIQGVDDLDKQIFSIQNLERFQLALWSSILQKQRIVAVATSTILGMMVVEFVYLEHGFDLLHVKGNVLPPILSLHVKVFHKSVRIAAATKFNLKKLRID